MGKDSPSPPATPDYTGAAAAQGAANEATARLQAKTNNPNIYTPLGSQTVSFGTPSFNQAGYDTAMAMYGAGRPTGPAPTQAQYTSNVFQNDGNGSGNVVPQLDQAGYDRALAAYNAGPGPAPTREQFTTMANADQPTITQTLTPDAQATLEAQQAVKRDLANLGVQGIGTAKNVLGSAFNPDLPRLQTSLDTSGIAKMPVNAGMTGQQAILSRLQPTLDQQSKATEQRLANQGLVPGGEAYENAKRSQGYQQNDLLTQAALQGIGLDTSANAQEFNQQLAQAQFGNTADQQSLAQQLQLRGQPLNEIIGLMGGSQIQMPQFQGYQPTNIAPAPVFAGAQAGGQAGMQNYGIQSANVNAANKGLYDLLGSAAMAFGMRPG
jgi:hypothetical protein